jgi:hypothetical protein
VLSAHLCSSVEIHADCFGMDKREEERGRKLGGHGVEFCTKQLHSFYKNLTNKGLRGKGGGGRKEQE